MKKSHKISISSLILCVTAFALVVVFIPSKTQAADVPPAFPTLPPPPSSTTTNPPVVVVPPTQPPIVVASLPPLPASPSQPQLCPILGANAGFIDGSFSNIVSLATLIIVLLLLAVVMKRRDI